MLLQYFGFKVDPFGVNPDPRCLYLSHTHRQALESLEFGFSSNRGFTAMIAPPGTGKTTLLFASSKISATPPASSSSSISIPSASRANLSPIFSATSASLPQAAAPRCTTSSPTRSSRKIAPAEFVIVIDEAQNLSDAVLERVRLLTNFETSRGKLIQIVLSGQSQLSEKLLHGSLVQLRQRISTVCHIESLSAEETFGYIDYRLKMAGYLDEPLFTVAQLSLSPKPATALPAPSTTFALTRWLCAQK